VAKTEEDETSKKLHLRVEETNTTNSLMPDAESRSLCREFQLIQDSAETPCTTTLSTAVDLDLMESPVQYTSDSQHPVQPVDDGADSRIGTSNKPGAETAFAAAPPSPFAAGVKMRKIGDETFDVCFQSALPEKTLSKYKSDEVAAINEAREMTKSALSNLTASQLMELGASDKQSKKLADLVMDGGKVMINADPEELYQTCDIDKHYRIYKEIQSYQCLLISAPILAEIENAASFDADNQRKREEEMDNFCRQAFPEEHFHAKGLNKTRLKREVSSSEDVKTCISEFFRRPYDEINHVRAKNAIHAIIVFFGHRSQQGFIVGQEHMDLNTIALLVEDEWKKALLRRPEQLPVKVNIIFPDEAIMTNRFKVTALTTESPMLYTSGFQRPVKFVDDGADSGIASSNKPDAEAATAAVPPSPSTAGVKLTEIDETSEVFFPFAPLEETLSKYKSDEVAAINKAREMIKSAFTNMTASRLMETGASDEQSKKLADLVMNGEKVEHNAKPDELYQTGYIYEYYRYLEEIQSYQCLLISAPVQTAIGNVASFNADDQRKREEEMDNFCCQAFPEEHFDAKRLDKTRLKREVSSSENVGKFIHEFFSCQVGIRAKNAIHALLVFFGHGSPQGFVVGQEHIDLNKITLLVKDEWREALLQHPLQLPVKVEIIFAQCYGHMYSKVVETDRFKVTALTTDKKFSTFTVLGFQGFVNYNLTLHTEEVLRPTVVKVESWRSSDKAGSVDLSKGHTSGDKSANKRSHQAVDEESPMEVEDIDVEPPFTRSKTVCLSPDSSSSSSSSSLRTD